MKSVVSDNGIEVNRLAQYNRSSFLLEILGILFNKNENVSNIIQKIDNRQNLSYKNGKKDFICEYCTDYSCLKCDKHVCDKQPGILCNIWNLWVHRSCAGIGKKEYEDLPNSDNDGP